MKYEGKLLLLLQSPLEVSSVTAKTLQVALSLGLFNNCVELVENEIAGVP